MAIGEINSVPVNSSYAVNGGDFVAVYAVNGFEDSITRITFKQGETVEPFTDSYLQIVFAQGKTVEVFTDSFLKTPIYSQAIYAKSFDDGAFGQPFRDLGSLVVGFSDPALLNVSLWDNANDSILGAYFSHKNPQTIVDSSITEIFISQINTPTTYTVFISQQNPQTIIDNNVTEVFVSQRKIN